MTRTCLKSGLMTVLASLLPILACVTINIYFPAEKVEAVAGEIVNEVRGQKRGRNNLLPRGMGLPSSGTSCWRFRRPRPGHRMLPRSPTPRSVH